MTAELAVRCDTLGGPANGGVTFRPRRVFRLSTILLMGHLQLEDFRPGGNVDGDLLRQIAVGDAVADFRDVAHLRRQGPTPSS